MVSGRGSYPLPLAPMGHSHFGLAHSHGHPSGGWLQIRHQLFPQFGSHGHKISGCELKLQIWSFVVGAKALARNNINHLI